MSLYLGDDLVSGVATPIEPTKNIGQIIQSTIPLSDAGLHLLDGALLQYASYKDFIDYIASIYDASANYFCSENDWQTSVTNYGVCGKFVYDSTNNTVRLPKYGNKAYTSLDNTVGVYGTGNALVITEDGSTLYNQGGSSTVGNSGFFATYSANSPVGSTTTAVAGHNKKYGIAPKTLLSGNDSGIIAQLSEINTDLDCYYYIVIANSTKTEIEIDIDEIATDLNGKADVDLSNCTKPYVTQTYHNGSSWYRVWSDGWCEQGGFYNNGSQQRDVYNIVINLPNSYNSINYNIILTAYKNDDSYINRSVVTGLYQKSTSGFTCGWYGISTNEKVDSLSWQTFGYIR